MVQGETKKIVQGETKKIVHFIRTKTLGTSYSETTYLSGLKLRLQRVLMSTPSCQISTPNRIVVFEYEVLKVFVCKSDTFFWSTLYKVSKFDSVEYS